MNETCTSIRGYSESVPLDAFPPWHAPCLYWMRRSLLNRAALIATLIDEVSKLTFLKTAGARGRDTGTIKSSLQRMRTFYNDLPIIISHQRRRSKVESLSSMIFLIQRLRKSLEYGAAQDDLKNEANHDGELFWNALIHRHKHVVNEHVLGDGIGYPQTRHLLR